MLGGLYGLTGASFALIKSLPSPVDKNKLFDPVHVSALLAGLNNPVDTNQAGKFKKELLYMIDFLKSLSIVYAGNSGGKANRLLHQIAKLERAGQVDAPELDGLKKELQGLINSAEVFEIANGGALSESKAALSNEALALLARMQKNSLKDLVRYEALIEETNYVQTKAFGEHLYIIASRSASFLLRKVDRFIQDNSHDKSRKINGLLSGVSILRSNWDTPDVQYPSEGIQDIDKHLSDEQERIRSSLKALGVSVDPGSELFDIYLERFQSFSKQVVGLYHGTNMLMPNEPEKSRLSKSVVDALSSMFLLTFRLDYDLELLKRLVFGDGNNADKTFEHVKDIYNSLKEAKFYLLHLDNNLLFLERLKSISLDTYGNTTLINPDVKEKSDMFSISEVMELTVEYVRSHEVGFGDKLEKIE